MRKLYVIYDVLGLILIVKIVKSNVLTVLHLLVAFKSFKML